jgi:plastocyanin
MANFGPQTIIELIVLVIVIGGLLYIVCSRTNAVEKTGLGSIIMLAIVALMIPVFWIAEANNQASATAAQNELSIQRGMQVYGEQCTPSCYGIVTDKNGKDSVVNAMWDGYPMSYYWSMTDDNLRIAVASGYYNPKALIQPANLGAVPRSDEYGGSISSSQIDYIMAFIRSTNPNNKGTNGLALLPAYLQLNDATLYASAVTLGKEGQFGASQDLTAQKAITITIVDPGTNGVQCQSQQGCFTPNNITVKVGTKITWVNKSKLAHTIVAVAGTDISAPKPASQIFDSKVQIPSNGTFSYTVTQAAYNLNSGTHNVLYYCSIHPDMVAQLNVVQ